MAAGADVAQPAVLAGKLDRGGSGDLSGDDASTCCGSSAAQTPASPVQPRPSAAQGAAWAAEIAKGFFALLQSFDDCPKVLQAHDLATNGASKNGASVLLRRCLQLLAMAGHGRDSLELTAAHAAVYLCRFTRALRKEDAKEPPLKEVAYIACIMLFLGHSHVEDVTLPLKSWHKYVFVSYCSLSMLNVVILKLMVKMDYKLMVTPEEICEHMRFFT